MSTWLEVNGLNITWQCILKFMKCSYCCLFIFIFIKVYKKVWQIGCIDIKLTDFRKWHWVVNHFNCVGLQFQNESVWNCGQLKICADNKNLESGCPWDNHFNFLNSNTAWNQNWVHFVRYLKIEYILCVISKLSTLFWKIIQAPWSNILHVLINNSITARPTKIPMPFLSFSDNLLLGAYIISVNRLYHLLKEYYFETVH